VASLPSSIFHVATNYRESVAIDFSDFENPHRIETFGEVINKGRRFEQGCFHSALNRFIMP